MAGSISHHLKMYITALGTCIAASCGDDSGQDKKQSDPTLEELSSPYECSLKDLSVDRSSEAPIRLGVFPNFNARYGEILRINLDELLNVPSSWSLLEYSVNPENATLLPLESMCSDQIMPCIIPSIKRPNVSVEGNSLVISSRPYNFKAQGSVTFNVRDICNGQEYDGTVFVDFCPVKE